MHNTLPIIEIPHLKLTRQSVSVFGTNKLRDLVTLTVTSFDLYVFEVSRD